MIILRLIAESFAFAFQAVIINKTRTLLSLLGITIGIFSIISVFTIFDSMERAIRKSIESLGNNILYIEKWAWSMGGDYPWWKYYQRPEPTLRDLEEIQKRSQAAAAAAFMVTGNKQVKYLNNSIDNVTIQAVTHDFEKMMTSELGEGRYFTPIESAGGRNVAILGIKIAENLFGNTDPVGKEIKIFGQKLAVIGVFKQAGEDMFGTSPDNMVMVPVHWVRNFIDLREQGTTILVLAKPNVSNDELRDELTGIMRSVRRLKPALEDNFSINETSIISKGFDQLFSVIAIVGWIIGGFSLLVGGFGIANIMFVSVKERTSQVGIQMSLGAKRYFILLQFLFEAIFLSLFGGIIGLIIILIATLILSAALDMELVLTQGNILLGIFVSSLIGLISGIFPSMSASRLNPVDAMRSNF
jgi:putative ABC transport system permease protein